MSFRPAAPCHLSDAGAVEDPESLHYILCHESVHYRHRDHFWSLARAICLCLHWYNPFVWLAASLSRQDGELACDEETVQWLGESKRLDYGMALLEFCAKGRTPFHSTDETPRFSIVDMDGDTIPEVLLR